MTTTTTGLPVFCFCFAVIRTTSNVTSLVFLFPFHIVIFIIINVGYNTLIIRTHKWRWLGYRKTAPWTVLVYFLDSHWGAKKSIKILSRKEQQQGLLHTQVSRFIFFLVFRRYTRHPAGAFLTHQLDYLSLCCLVDSLEFCRLFSHKHSWL